MKLSDLCLIESGANASRQSGSLTETKEGSVLFHLFNQQATYISHENAHARYGQNEVQLTPTDRLDGKYLWFLLKYSPKVQSQLTLSRQQFLNKSKITVNAIKQIELDPLPPLDKQKVIASVAEETEHLEQLEKRKAEILSKSRKNQLKNLANLTF